jgi:selenocysteine lyase/cysteine desulfurase
MTITRRDLLALAAAVPAFRGLAHAPLPMRSHRELPHDAGPDDEAAWERIGQEFVIEGTHLNTGTIGSSPLPVIEATIHHLRAFERMIGQEAVDGVALHAELEAFLGAWPGSVAIVRNTTEAMSIVAAGIDLQAGDEVVSTTHEHIGGRCCWELLASRRGVVYKTFTPPLNPMSEAELAAAWMAQVTPRTRVFSISHVLFSTGMIQPVRALVRMARERGIITVIDGAHPPGLLELNLRDLDADFYASSPHKWLLAPKGTGLLIVRPDRMATTWPLVGSGDWAATDIKRFEHVGTSNDSLLAGLRAAVQFQQAIGRRAIELRARGLATQLHAMLAKLPRVQVVSPTRPEFRAGMVAFRMEGTTATALQGYLGAQRIRTRRIAESNLEYLRLSTHIYTFPRDLERTVALLKEAPRG